MTNDDDESKYGTKTINDGDFTTRALQTDQRVNIPEQYASYAGIDSEKEIAVVAKDGKLVITEANMNSISEAKGEENGR
jgi:hypothetical protein